ncbi:MAG: hypothetical protein MJ007_01700 [Paludibacteraceae bacterium]|nr:hypothetical protein [Paludibacteraceae bacterium]
MKKAVIIISLLLCASVASARGIVKHLAVSAAETAVDMSVAHGVNKSIQEGEAAKAAKEAGWTCPQCGQSGNQGNFCINCGSPKPQPAETWECPACHQKGNKGNFCTNCGNPKIPQENVQKLTHE